MSQLAIRGYEQYCLVGQLCAQWNYLLQKPGITNLGGRITAKRATKMIYPDENAYTSVELQEFY